MKERILMVVFVLIMGTLLTGSLVGVNLVTAPVIERNRELRVKRSVLGALQIQVGQDDQDVEAIFARAVEARVAGERTFYTGRDTGDVAFEYTGAGLWGPIQGAIAVGDDFSRIRGLTVSRQEETPGLGSRITEPGFLDQFRDKTFEPALVLVPPDRSRGDREVDGITGATMTATAFVKLLNDNLSAAREAYRGGSP